MGEWLRMDEDQKRVAFVGAYKMEKGNLDKVCEFLGIKRASFYSYKKRFISDDNEEITIEGKAKIIEDGSKSESTKRDELGLPDHTAKQDAIQSLISILQADSKQLTVADIEAIIEKKMDGFGQQYRGVKATIGGEQRKIEGVMAKWGDHALKLLAINLGTEPIGQPVCLLGPTGCGKTHTAAMLALALGLRFGAISMSGGISESHLIGRHLPTGEGGTFEFHASPFLDFVRHGGLYMLDEADAADANVMVYANTLLANGYVEVPHLGTGGRIEAHPKFRIICAGNTNLQGATREYQGRNALDGATINRLQTGIIQCDYDDGVEKAITDPEVYEWAKSIRKGIEECGVMRVMSTRDMVQFSKQRSVGISMTKIEQTYFCTWTKEEKKKVKAAAA